MLVIVNAFTNVNKSKFIVKHYLSLGQRGFAGDISVSVSSRSNESNIEDSRKLQMCRTVSSTTFVFLSSKDATI